MKPACLERHPNGYRIRRFRRCLSCGHNSGQHQALRRSTTTDASGTKTRVVVAPCRGRSPSWLLMTRTSSTSPTPLAIPVATLASRPMHKTTIQKIVERKTAGTSHETCSVLKPAASSSNARFHAKGPRPCSSVEAHIGKPSPMKACWLPPIPSRHLQALTLANGFAARWRCR